MIVEEGLSGRTHGVRRSDRGHAQERRAHADRRSSRAMRRWTSSMIMLGTNDFKDQLSNTAYQFGARHADADPDDQGPLCALVERGPEVLVVTPPAITEDAEPAMWGTGHQQCADHANYLEQVAAPHRLLPFRRQPRGARPASTASIWTRRRTRCSARPWRRRCAPSSPCETCAESLYIIHMRSNTARGADAGSRAPCAGRRRGSGTRADRSGKPTRREDIMNLKQARARWRSPRVDGCRDSSPAASRRRTTPSSSWPGRAPDPFWSAVQQGFDTGHQGSRRQDAVDGAAGLQRHRPDLYHSMFEAAIARKPAAIVGGQLLPRADRAADQAGGRPRASRSLVINSGGTN